MRQKVYIWVEKMLLFQKFSINQEQMIMFNQKIKIYQLKKINIKFKIMKRFI